MRPFILALAALLSCVPSHVDSAEQAGIELGDLTPQQFRVQRDSMMGAVDRQLSRSYKRNGWPGTFAEVDLEPHYTYWVAVRVQYEYWHANWDTDLMVDERGVYLAVWYRTDMGGLYVPSGEPWPEPNPYYDEKGGR